MNRRRSNLWFCLILWACQVGCSDPVDKIVPKPTSAIEGISVNGQVVKPAAIFHALERRVDSKKLSEALEALKAKPIKTSQLRSNLEMRFGKLAVREAWEHCIFESLADQAIKKAGVKVVDKDLAERLVGEMELYKERPASAWMSYEQHLKSKGSSISRRKEDLKREIGLDKILGEPTGAMVNDYFRQNYDDYSGRKVELFHILIKDKTEALRVLRALERGDDFGTLAKKHSAEKSTAKKGGRVAWIRRRGDVPRDLSVAAFKLKVKRGSLGGPVKTVYGWHLFRINGERPGKKISLKEIRPRILLALKKQRRVQFMIAERKKAEISSPN